MLKYLVVGTVAVAIAVSTPIVATASAESWSGPYIGLHAGWIKGGWDGSVHTDTAGPDAQPWSDPSASLDGENWTGGAHVGFQARSGSLVYGVELDVNYADMNESASFFTDLNTDDGYAWDVDLKMKWFGSARARLGYLVTPNFLIYGTAGIAVADTSGHYVSSHVWIPDPQHSLGVTARGSVNETHVGWVAGLGAEMELSERVGVRAEWLHYDFGSEPYRFVTSDGYKADSFRSDLDVDVIRVGFNYRFGG